MSAQESPQYSTKASLTYTLVHPGKRANAFSFHHKIENGFLPFVFPSFVHFHFFFLSLCSALSVGA